MSYGNCGKVQSKGAKEAVGEKRDKNLFYLDIVTNCQEEIELELYLPYYCVQISLLGVIKLIKALL